MNFMEIASNRQSCRSYEEGRAVEQEKLNAILEATRLSPSACNGQPYHLTVCTGETAKQVAAATQAPICIVISEMPYVKSAAMGARVKNNDYRSIDIGIATAYLTAEATAQGLSTCILGWFDDEKIRAICNLGQPVRLVITLGYAKETENLREKKRRSIDDLVTFR